MDVAARLTGRRGLMALAGLAVAGLVGGYGVASARKPKAVRVSEATPKAVGKATAEPGIFVHVAGAVVRPGLFRVRTGARIADAIEAAGGPSPEADLDAVNLAGKIRDGDKVLVPAKASAGSGPGPPAGAASGSAGGRINLNTASASELDGLPGIGPALAERIIAYRTEHGGFRSVDELGKVPGIGPKKFQELQDLVTV